MSPSELAQRYRVTAGFLVGLFFVYACRPTFELLAVGAVVSLTGLALRFWAAGHLRKARELTTSGPYGFTRNPLYLGSFLIVLGFTVAGGSAIPGAVVLALYVLFYVPTVYREEAELRRGFTEEFDRYAAAVPRFFPRLVPYRSSGGSFRLAQYLLNREYNSFIGCAAGYTVIYLKLRMLAP